MLFLESCDAWYNQQSEVLIVSLIINQLMKVKAEFKITTSC